MPMWFVCQVLPIAVAIISLIWCFVTYLMLLWGWCAIAAVDAGDEGRLVGRGGRSLGIQQLEEEQEDLATPPPAGHHNHALHQVRVLVL